MLKTGATFESARQQDSSQNSGQLDKDNIAASQRQKKVLGLG